MKIGYFIKDHGYTIKHAIYFDVESFDATLSGNCQRLAETASRHAWDKGGWEWMRHDTILTLVYDGKEQGDFEIEVENTQSFHATRQ